MGHRIGLTIALRTKRAARLRGLACRRGVPGNMCGKLRGLTLVGPGNLVCAGVRLGRQRLTGRAGAVSGRVGTARVRERPGVMTASRGRHHLNWSRHRLR